jgi:type I restriction enzyme S subunit
MKDRVLRDFTVDDIKKIADTFHAWQLGEGYEDVPGFCYSATLDDIRKHEHVLTPGRYVGAEEQEEDGEVFADKMARLTAQLAEQFAESAKLEGEIKKNLAGLVLCSYRSKADPYFVHYALQSPACRGWVARSAAQSAQPNFNLKEIGDLPIPKFSLAVQKHISVSLRNLDSKIALNRRINQTLEAMAQAIFKSWFVDFDPVKAKIAAIQEGRDPLRAAMIAISGKPDTELDALPPEQYDSLAATAALFPDEMEESELGDIPRGWACGALGDICSFTAGSAFKPEHQGSTEGEFPFIKVSDMNLAGNEVFIQSANNYVSKSQQSEMKAKLHPSGATVFAKIGVALISNRRRLLTTPTIIDNNLMSANLVEGKSGQYFLYSLLSTFDFNTLVSGTALPYINVSDLKKIPIVRPPYDACHAFEAKASSFFSMMQTLASQSLTLVTTRDTLLPKLLSGEIEVSGIFEG